MVPGTCTQRTLAGQKRVYKNIKEEQEVESDGWGLALGEVWPESVQPGRFSEVKVSWTDFWSSLLGLLLSD